MPVTLRPVQTEDDAFLFQVYASTRAEEMALVDWSQEQKQAFLEMQFNAQRQHYLAYYPDARYHIILREQVSIGRLIVNRSDEEILVIDIALLQEHRGAGIGTDLIRELQAEAAQTGKPLRLHVEIFNPAQRLYARLGFVKIAELGVYYELEWKSKE